MSISVAVPEPEKKEKKKLTVINPTLAEQKYKWNFSASQVELWQLCQRKYGFKYIDKIKGENKFANRGQEMHTQLENWLINGVEPDITLREGRLARTAVVKGFLPLPGEAFIERGFKFITPRGFSYLSYLDIEFFDKDINRPVVGDHKSTTDFKWAHTPESLVQAVQPVIYSNISFENWNTDEVLLRWVYYKDAKTRPSARKVEALAYRADMSAKMVKIDEIAEDIALNGLTVKQAKDLPKNPLACEKYGGCPYEPICGVTDMERLGAIMEQSSIREKLMANKMKVEEVKQAESINQPAVAQPSALSALDRMRQRSAEAAKQQAATTKPVVAVVTAPVAVQQVAAVVPKAGNSVLQRLALKKAQTAAISVTETSQPVAKAEQGVVPSTAQLQKELDSESTVMSPELAAAIKAQVQKIDAAPSHNAFDINPPEQPRGDQIIDDPDVLAAQVAEGKAGQKKAVVAAVETEKKPRGRPAGSTTVKPLGDEAYIFGRVYAEVCRESRGDNELASTCATAAVRAFREID